MPPRTDHPVLRRCVLRVEEELAARGAVREAGDVFFLTRAEVEASLKPGPVAGLQQDISQRRQTWERQRRLTPPLTLGTAPAPARKIYATAIEASRTQGAVPVEGGLAGEPASPGRATGPVHVILDPADFSSFQTGQVLVARATSPAWTPLFANAAAVITDGGTLAAHASLIAREYGTPAVVATTDATTRLRDGQLVTVDGGALAGRRVLQQTLPDANVLVVAQRQRSGRELRGTGRAQLRDPGGHHPRIRRPCQRSRRDRHRRQAVLLVRPLSHPGGLSGSFRVRESRQRRVWLALRRAACRAAN